MNVEKKSPKFISNAEFVFYEFLQLVERLFCQPCWIKKNGLQNKQYHHHGGIYHLLVNQEKMTEQAFVKWKANTDSGFLSGLFDFFCTSLLTNNSELLSAIKDWPSQIYVKDKNLNFEKLALACIFNQRRDSFKVESNICRELFDEFDCFLKPILISIYCNLDNVWLSHISEHIVLKQNNFIHINFYPELHWNRSDSIHLFEQKLLDCKDDFAVTLDYLPIHSSCHGHLVNDNLFAKSMCMGVMPVKKLAKYNSELKSDDFMGRCHPWMSNKVKIPIEEWIFVYRNASDLKCINKNKCSSINIETFDLFFKVCRMIHGRVEGLATKWDVT